MHLPRWGLFFVTGAACLLSAPCHSSAQDCDECAVASYLQSGFTPDSQHHAAFQFNYRYRHEPYNGDSKQGGEPDEKIADSTFNFFYSVRVFEPLFIDVNIPFTSQAYTLRPDNTYQSDRDTALSDMSLLATLQPLAESYKTGAVDWRIRAGVKLPTGDTGKLGSFTSGETINNGGSNIYSYDRSFGSGSFDWIAGSSLFVREDRFVGIADLQYIGRTTGDNSFRFGDRATVHLNPGFVFYTRGKDTFVLLLDTSYTFVSESEFEGGTVANTGENSFYMGPRILATFNDTFSTYIGVSLPIYHDMQGTQLATDYRIIASIMGAL